MAKYYELDNRDRKPIRKRPDTLGYTPMLIVVYGALSVLLAIVLVAGSMAGIEVSDSSSVTQEEMDATLLWWPIAAAVSGVAALAAGFLARGRMRFTVCMACMVVADVAVLIYAVPVIEMAVLSVILLAVGVLMTFRVNKNRSSFTD